jgi:superfamily II DNA helicase RecQ
MEPLATCRQREAPSNTVTPALSTALKHNFGFDSFRPGQEEIVSDVLAGRDLLAIMPTGGGKSLCFQLPAIMRPGVSIVVSPLIALMQDQIRLLQNTASARPPSTRVSMRLRMPSASAPYCAASSNWSTSRRSDC